MKIRIITDSASDLLAPHRPEVTVLPMTITFGEEQFLDGVDLTHRQFYEKLIEGEAAKLSGTCQSACIAAEDFPGKVFVVDSANATIGERILVERGLELMDQGLDAAAIAARLDEEKTDIRLVALLDTLEYLKRGGRVSASVALVGGLLAIKPVVAVQDGEVVVLGKARGSKNGNNLLVQEIQKTGVDFSRPYKLGYAGLNDSLLQKYIADSAALWEGHTDALPTGTVGGTIGTHVGPGAIAVAFFQKH